MPLKMLGARVAIIPIEDPSYHGSLVIPDEAKQRIDQGVVAHIGPAVVDLKVGDHVIFSGYTGTKVSVEEEGIYFVMEETDVDLIIEDGEGNLLFPKETVLRLLDEAEVEAYIRGEQSPIFLSLMKDKISNYFFGEGLEF